MLLTQSSKKRNKKPNKGQKAPRRNSGCFLISVSESEIMRQYERENKLRLGYVASGPRMGFFVGVFG